MRTLSFLPLLILPAFSAFSQTGYPQGYFRDPLDIPITLSGNFGELRAGHYHMGIDIKTNQRENLSVHAAAEGYISRIKIEPGGFGRAIYITHPNGYTTVYAHLNDFTSRVEAYVKRQQYALESWKVDLVPPAGLFPVKQGEFIAFSGTTGGSQAPHLHFEIRRTDNEINLNPLLFGLPFKDEVKPRILRLAIYDRTKSLYEQTPKVYTAQAVSGASYTTSPGLIKVNSPLVSFAVSAYDAHTGSANHNGIFGAKLLVNGAEEESFVMDNISYNATRYMNAHIDYRYRVLSGAYLQHLSELPGYLHSIYAKGGGHGVVDVSNGDIYDIAVEVRDTEGNRSVITTRIQYVYKEENRSAGNNGNNKMFYPLMLDGFESENCEFYIGERCLYDSVHIRYSNDASGSADVISDVHTIGSSYIPLHEPILVRIRPDLSFTPADSPFTVMQCVSGSRSEVQKVQWQGEWASARFRDFGAFRLIRDTVPPQIVPSGFTDHADLSKASRIVFSVRDNLPGVKNVRTELDGSWLRFTNDKGRYFIYRFDEQCPRGPHVLRISAEDEAGNTTVGEYRFTR